jgi:hypothetical protein
VNEESNVKNKTKTIVMKTSLCAIGVLGSVILSTGITSAQTAATCDAEKGWSE